MNPTTKIYASPSVPSISRRLVFLANEERSQLAAFQRLQLRQAEVWRAHAQLTEAARHDKADDLAALDRLLAEAQAVALEAADLQRRQRLLWAEVEELTARLDAYSPTTRRDN